MQIARTLHPRTTFVGTDPIVVADIVIRRIKRLKKAHAETRKTQFVIIRENAKMMHNVARKNVLTRNVYQPKRIALLKMPNVGDERTHAVIL